MDGQVDGRMDGWAGRSGWVVRPSRAGKTGRGGGRVRRGRTGTGCPSMNVACGRRPKNARSTKIRRSVTFVALISFTLCVYKLVLDCLGVH